MKKGLFLLIFISLIINIFAQGFEVQKFQLDTDNEDALTHHRFDKSGNMCALVVVRSSLRDVRFTAKESGIIEQIPHLESNEIWLYLSPIANTLLVEKTHFAPLSYLTPALQSGKTYIMELVENDGNEQVSKGTIFIKSQPPQANVQLNKIPNGTTPKFITGLKPGTYEVRLTAEGYHEWTEDVVVTSGKTTDVSATLLPIDSAAAAALKKANNARKRNKKGGDWQPKNGFTLALNAGMSKVNNYTANFYNGSHENANSLNVVVMNTYQPTYHESIVNAIGYNFDSLTAKDLPQNMAYDITYAIGFYGGWNFAGSNRLFIEFDYNRLKTGDVFLIYRDKTYLGPLEYTECKIRGIEDRFYINLGYSHDFRLSEHVRLYLEGGGHLTANIVRKNDIQIPNKNDKLHPLEFDIKYNGVRNMNDLNYQRHYNIRQGGIGFGGFVGTGIRLIFSEMVSLDPGIQFYYSNVNYNVDKEWKQYNDYKFWFQAFVRLTFSNLW